MPTRCRPPVKNNEGYNEFCDALDVVVPDAARFPQRTTDLVELYGAAVAAMGPFEEVVEQAARRAATEATTNELLARERLEAARVEIARLRASASRARFRFGGAIDG